MKIVTANHTCECGNTIDLEGNYYYIGGQGNVQIYECPECLDAKWEASMKACELLRRLAG